MSVFTFQFFRFTLFSGRFRSVDSAVAARAVCVCVCACVCVCVCLGVWCIGTVMGITNTIATISGFITPSVVGAFTQNEVRTA